MAKAVTIKRAMIAPKLHRDYEWEILVEVERGTSGKGPWQIYRTNFHTSHYHGFDVRKPLGMAMEELGKQLQAQVDEPLIQIYQDGSHTKEVL